MRNLRFLMIALLSGLLLVSLAACGKKKRILPNIFNINNSTASSSPVGLAIEINGSGFQATSGEVHFTEVGSGINAVVVPAAGEWGDTGIVVVVPAGNGIAQFTVPGTVQVTVKTTGGTSNAINLNLLAAIAFNVNNVTWSNTTVLPVPMAGLGAVAVKKDSANAFLIVAGGYDGAANVTTVLSTGMVADGQLDSNWGLVATNPLPAARAHHGMVLADSSNSLVPMGSAFVYVLGGQQLAADAPGGTSTVFRATVNPSTGAVGVWSTLNTALPESMVGPSVVLFNGYIYVVGGLSANGMPSTRVYSAQVNADGSLTPWVTSPNPYPVGVSFASAFGFGGKLYVLGGDTGVSTDPNEQGAAGVKNVRIATARRGVIGAWVTAEQTIKQRKKHVTWSAFGQVIHAEGVYDGIAGSAELEGSVIQVDGTLAPWNSITAAAIQIGANVYNPASIVSPLQSVSGKPRFLLIGGQGFAAVPPGALSDKIFYNNLP